MTATATTTLQVLPTRLRIDPTTYAGDAVLYVTQNESGSLRTVEADRGALKVGQVIEARHINRGTSYGLLTIVGRVLNGRKYGEVPEAQLPFRVGQVVVEAAEEA